MKIAVWKTGHEIADRVADAVKLAFPDAEICYAFDGMNVRTVGDINIGYGILRGMADVFRECDRQGKPYIHLDRGYFKPGHYNGYYRVSLCGTQQVIGLNKFESDGKRFAALGVGLEDGGHNPDGHILLVPSTEYTKKFFGRRNTELSLNGFDGNDRCITRFKGDNTPLDDHLRGCKQVVTFNSSIGWEALRRGIPVISDPTHSIVGAYQKLVDKPLHLDFNERRKLFGIMGDLQMTLEEIRNGHLCSLIQKLVSLHNNSTYMSAGIAGSQSQATLQPTA